MRHMKGQPPFHTAAWAQKTPYDGCQCLKKIKEKTFFGPGAATTILTCGAIFYAFGGPTTVLPNYSYSTTTELLQYY